MIKKLKTWAAALKRDGLVLWFAYRDPRTPLLAKFLCVGVVAYALSPIDLIPDFIPILGYLDELILMPIAITIALRLIPDEVIHTARGKADAWIAERKPRPRNWVGAAIVVSLWLGALYALWRWLAP
ncbi:MAG: YkvA family protein [Burkholderiales bacterium]